jgi:hypothetical protein
MRSSTTHNAVIPFYKLTVGLNLNIPVNTRGCFRLTDVRAMLYSVNYLS